VSHLNDAGDILVGMDDKLVVIRTAVYAAAIDVELQEKQSAILADFREAMRATGDGEPASVNHDLLIAAAEVHAAVEDTVVSTITSAAALAAHYIWLRSRGNGKTSTSMDAASAAGTSQSTNDAECFSTARVPPADPAEEEEVRLARYKRPGDAADWRHDSRSSRDNSPASGVEGQRLWGEGDSDFSSGSGSFSDSDWAQDAYKAGNDGAADDAAARARVQARLNVVGGLDDLAGELENLDLEQLKGILGESVGGMAAVGMLAGGRAWKKSTKKKRRKKVKVTGEKALKHAKDSDVVLGLQEYRVCDSVTFKLENSMRPKKV